VSTKVNSMQPELDKATARQHAHEIW